MSIVYHENTGMNVKEVECYKKSKKTSYSSYEQLVMFCQSVSFSLLARSKISTLWIAS